LGFLSLLTEGPSFPAGNRIAAQGRCPPSLLS
jgi:hypothetical protein